MRVGYLTEGPAGHARYRRRVATGAAPAEVLRVAARCMGVGDASISTGSDCVPCGARHQHALPGGECAALALRDPADLPLVPQERPRCLVDSVPPGGHRIAREPPDLQEAGWRGAAISGEPVRRCRRGHPDPWHRRLCEPLARLFDPCEKQEVQPADIRGATVSRPTRVLDSDGSIPRPIPSLRERTGRIRRADCFLYI